MMDLIKELLHEILSRLIDIQQRNARIETRLFKLAEGLDVELKNKEDWK